VDPRYIETAPLSHIEYWWQRGLAFEKAKAAERERRELEDKQLAGR